MQIKPTTEGPEKPKCEKSITTTGNNASEQPEPEQPEPKPTHPLQPPPIPPRWTRPDIGALSTTPASPSSDKRSSSAPPPTDRERGITAVDSDAAVRSKIEIDATFSASFANLTLNSSAAIISPSAPRATVRGAPPSPFKSPTKKSKFYSVTIGKRTGVFNSWPYVESLVHGVPGNKQISFKTEADAYDHYFTAKSNGMVKVVRVNSADDDVFGPVEQAIE